VRRVRKLNVLRPLQVEWYFIRQWKNPKRKLSVLTERGEYIYRGVYCVKARLPRISLDVISEEKLRYIPRVSNHPNHYSSRLTRHYQWFYIKLRCLVSSMTRFESWILPNYKPKAQSRLLLVSTSDTIDPYQISIEIKSFSSRPPLCIT
jgi:hypothetical protein